MALQWGTIR